MLKLYYSPGAVSLATHIALEEANLPYTLELVAIHEGKQYTPEYRLIHPLGRVPALDLGGGDILTETPALLWYVSSTSAVPGLLPQDPRAVAHAMEWMSMLASAVHVAFISFFRPKRYTDDDAAHEALRRDGKARFAELLRVIERRLPETEFLFGERYSLVDAYTTVFYLWGRRFDLPVADLPRYSALARRVLGRPAVRRALEQEGLGAIYAPGSWAL